MEVSEDNISEGNESDEDFEIQQVQKRKKLKKTHIRRNEDRRSVGGGSSSNDRASTLMGGRRSEIYKSPTREDLDYEKSEAEEETEAETPSTSGCSPAPILSTPSDDSSSFVLSPSGWASGFGRSGGANGAGKVLGLMVPAPPPLSASLREETNTDQAAIRTKKRKRRRVMHSFGLYVYRVLRDIHPIEIGISKKAMDIVNSFLTDMFDKLVNEALRLMIYTQRKTLSSRELNTAARLILPGTLATHAIKEAQRAVELYRGIIVLPNNNDEK